MGLHATILCTGINILLISERLLLNCAAYKQGSLGTLQETALNAHNCSSMRLHTRSMMHIQ
jgi:hypothetical protein